MKIKSCAIPCVILSPPEADEESQILRSFHSDAVLSKAKE